MYTYIFIHILYIYGHVQELGVLIDDVTYMNYLLRCENLVSIAFRETFYFIKLARCICNNFKKTKDVGLIF